VTDEHDEREQARIRALLAAAGSTGPHEAIPTDVAARLDDTLAALATERRRQDSGLPTSAASSERAARRRRRWPTLLAAAAVASVLGIGLTEVLDDGNGRWGAGVGSEEAMSGAAPESGDAGAADRDSRAATPSVPDLRSDSLAVDLEQAAVASLAFPADENARTYRRACVQPELRPGDAWMQVRLDGRPAVLVLRAPEGRRHAAQVFTCDDGETPAASTRIRTR
jgi:hypothetical protein